MSIGTYSELQTAVATWLHSTSYTSLIPDWIQAGENRLNDLLSLTPMQAFTTLTASTSSRFLALPDRFNGPISLYLIVSNVRTKLTALGPENMAARVNIISSTQPRFYSIGDQIEFDSTPDQAYSLTFNYYKKLALATDLTNFLLTSNYKAYLYAALVEAYTYKEDDAKVARYEALLQGEVDRLSEADTANRAVNNLRTDIALSGRPRSTIFAG